MKRNYPVIDALASKLDFGTYHLLFTCGGDDFESDVEQVAYKDLASPTRCAEEYRDYIEKLGLGASDISFGKVVRADNHKLVATIAYNGKIHYEN